MLLPRVLTAVFGIPLLLFLIHWGGLPYSIFVVTISILSLYEYGVILTLGKRQVQRWVALIGGAVVALSLVLGGPVALALAVLLFAATVYEMMSDEHSLERLALTVFGAVFFGLMPGYLALIRDIRPDGEKLTYLLFVAIWAMDSAAYAVGKGFGRRKIAPILSPRKTWEGAAAGFVAALFVAILFKLANQAAFSWVRMISAGVLIGICGQFSDLAESLIKRSVGAKDSGEILPGHGGIMDRFDSLLLTAPVFYYCLTLI